MCTFVFSDFDLWPFDLQNYTSPVTILWTFCGIPVLSRRKVWQTTDRQTNIANISHICWWNTTWVKKTPAVLWHFFPNGLEFLISCLHTYYMILYTLDYKFLFNYFQLWRSYAILSATTQRIFTFHYNFNFYVCLPGKWRHWWRHAISDMFIDIIKLFIL